MTNRAVAISRASAVVGSYSWGSALGFVMMLVTWTRLPPSCAAMLPQKFSAATTLGRPLEMVPAPLVAQPVSATRSRSGMARDGRDTASMISKIVVKFELGVVGRSARGQRFVVDR